MRVTFLGACREVTGSHFLLEANTKKILIECGIFQGSKLAEERNYAPFAFEVKSLDAVVICHAHLDHTGRLPKLVKEGFSGPILATEPTRDLTRIVLEDSEKLIREDSERENHQPLFNQSDVEKTISQFVPVNFNQEVEIASGIKLRFRNAGHILGSATAHFESKGQSLVYTSDLGNTPCDLLDPPQEVEACDFVICESTYGGRTHEDITLRQTELTKILSATIAQNGILLIPSFAVERTQDLLHEIDHFCEVDKCEKPTFYLDSPLATKVTKVFGKYPQYLSQKLRKEHKDFDFFGLERVVLTETVDQSKEIRNSPNPKIIIAGSGMMNGGRILFHARDFLGDARNTLLIVGYQPEGTLGRRLLDGEREVKILGTKIKVRAKVCAIGSYSAHADLPQILAWLEKIRGLKRAFIVHGESDQSLTLASHIEKQLSVKTAIPQTGEVYNL